MSREVRRVPSTWDHPRYTEDDAERPQLIGRLKPLHEGYAKTASDFLAMANKDGLQAAVEYWGNAPNQEDYMPEWKDEERTHYQMYETCSEGTPISPVLDTPENLARWLADNGASSFGSRTATYDQWLSVCCGGWAPSAVMVSGVLKSGVEAMGDKSV